MGAWDWLLGKNVRPDYSQAEDYYKRMLGIGEEMRGRRMQDWEAMQKRAFGDIRRGVAQRWGGTGANLLGVESSLPGQWETTASTRWMQDVGNPMARSIEQEWMQGRMAAEQARQQLRTKAEAEARAESGGGLLSPLAGIAGGVGGFLLGGPAGAMAGYGLGSSLGKGLSRGGGESPGYNWYLDPQMWQNQGAPIYSPSGWSNPYQGQGYGWA